MRERRFPPSEIVSLLEAGRRFNLAESTTQDLKVGDLLKYVGDEEFRGLKLSYGTAKGLPALRETIANRAGVASDNVLVTSGAALGIALVALELCDEYSEALLFKPCFPPSRDLLVGIGTRVREIPLAFEDGLQVDLEQFADALSPDVALISLASPQNPSGVATPLSKLRMMLEIMADRAPQARLFIDETYIDADYGTPLQTASALDPRIIVGSSLSKAHGAPGLRTGWLIIHDDDLLARLVTAKLNLVISGSPLDETLANVLLQHSTELMGPRRVFLRKALDKVIDWQAAHAEYIDWIKPDGGALCVMRLRSEAFTPEQIESFWNLMGEHELQLSPGVWFGLTKREFRLGFAFLPHDELERGLSQLSAFIKQIAPVG